MIVLSSSEGDKAADKWKDPLWAREIVGSRRTLNRTSYQNVVLYERDPAGIVNQVTLWTHGYLTMLYVYPSKAFIDNDTEADTDQTDFSHFTGVWGVAETCSRPGHQSALVLHGLQQPYILTSAHPIPEILHKDEILIRTQAIGHYGFGIPSLPYVAGRDLVGIVAEVRGKGQRVQVGDVVLYPSTDYRDTRKSTYQQYVVAAHYNVCKLPTSMPVAEYASIGVAFVAATMMFGVSLGIVFPRIKDVSGVDLLAIVRQLPSGALPPDIQDECLKGMPEEARPQKGDWIAIWGGSSTTALFSAQIALLAGLRVILVADTAKHGGRIGQTSNFTWIDSHNPDRAVEVIRGITGNRLQYGIDTVGGTTAASLQGALSPRNGQKAHLVGLAGLPKQRSSSIVYHSVPIKLFHESAEVGAALMGWLEVALAERRLGLPEVTVVEGGFEAVNTALDQMRRGEVSGRRLVVPVR